MYKEYEKNLDIILDEDPQLFGKKESAEYFLKLIKKGESIEEAIPGLIRLFKESKQVPDMEPAADAFIYHCLDNGQLKAIKDFIDTSENNKMFSLASVKRVAETNKDISSLLPLLLDYSLKHRHDISYILIAYLRQKSSDFSSKLKAITKLILDNSKAHHFLPYFIKDAIIDEMNMSDALPALAILLSSDSDNLREESIITMNWAVTSGNDFTSIVDILEAELKEDKRKKDSISSILSYFYISKNNWISIKNLIDSSVKEIRYGTFLTLNTHLNKDKDNSSQILLSILEGFKDSETKTRQLIWKGILQAERNNIRIIPKSKYLKKMIKELKSSNNKEILEYLYHISAKDVEVAQLIINSLSKLSSKSNETISQLKVNLNDLLKGSHSPVCTICRFIPRSKYFSDIQDLPKEAKKLKVGNIIAGTKDRIRNCPNCENYYYYSYEEEYEGMHIDITIILRRMDPIEILKTLKGKKKEIYKKKLPQLLQKNWTDLDHPEEYARSEAAWFLATYFLTNKLWDDLLKLTNNTNLVIRQNSLSVLSQAGTNKMPFENFKPLFKDGLNSEDQLIQNYSSTILAQKFIKEKEIDQLIELLNHDNNTVVSSTTREIWMSVRYDNFNISSITDDLKRLTESNKESIRDHARYALKEAWKDSRKPVPDIFLKNLSNKDPEIRDDAVASLEGVDISSFLSKIIEVINNKATQTQGLHVLYSASKWGKLDISEALPALILVLQDEHSEHHEMVTHTLFFAMKNKFDISSTYDILGKHLWWRELGSDQDIFRMAMDRDENLLLLEPHLVKCLDKRLDNYYGDSVVYLLTYIYVREKKWKKLNLLLNHKNKEIPGKVAEHLSTENDNYSFLIYQLVQNLIHNVGYIRITASSALINLVQQDYDEKIIEKIKKLVGELKTKKATKFKEQNMFLDELKKIEDF